MGLENLDHERRYDIDWLRVISISFLLVYHIVLMYQPWGFYIGFIQSPETNETIWIPMALLNVWRIPLLFFVSGMGVCFALRKRDWKELLKDRAIRILLPLVFGSFLIVPIHQLIFAIYYNQEFSYLPNVGHLWFLLNICIYVTQVIGFAFLDQKYDYKFFNMIRSMLKKPYFVYIFIIPFILEAVLLNPQYFSLYVGTSHGFILGMLAFFFGFLFIAIGKPFWLAIEKLWIINLFLAFGLYLIRLFYFDLNGLNYLTSIESMCWIFSILGIGYKYLNKPFKLLTYLSQSAYPVYIIHMIFLYWAAYIIFPLNLPLWINIVIVIVLTFIGCYLTFYLIIKRINFLRPLFGMKRK